MSSQQDLAKWAAARAALQYVHSGMVIGLGTGSTAEKFVELLAQKVHSEHWDVVCVPTSQVTANQAKSLGLRLDSNYPNFGHIDVTIDGADEVDPLGCLIKGGGGALLREKYVALASSEMIVVVDECKHVPTLGVSFRLPVEVVAFAWNNTMAALQALGAECTWRMRDGKLFVTDQGNYIADCNFGPISEPSKLHQQLKAISGVVETGIFAGIAAKIVTGRADGTSEVIDLR